MTSLLGMHDVGGQSWMADDPGWLVITEALGCDPNDTSGVDYRPLSNAGLGVIVRLNHGYGSTGTIPLPDRYVDFAARCAHFVAASPGCTRWIIGNEPNHSQERPGGQVIAPGWYADCYRLCRDAIHLMPGHAHDEVLVAAIAPWNVESGDWLLYFGEVLAELLNSGCDGLALHTYTHGSDPALITSTATMDPPYESRYYHFLAYQDFLLCVPPALRGLPVYITETDQDVPWTDVNDGWIQAAAMEIDGWNRTAGTQKIHCVCMYRWSGDQWALEGKQQRMKDFAAAVALGIESPRVTPPEPGPQPPEPGPEPTPIEWDPRLTLRGASISSPVISHQSPVLSHQSPVLWRCTVGRWFNEQESQGRHNVYVDVRDEAGNRAVGTMIEWGWPGITTQKAAENKSDPWLTSMGIDGCACDFPMHHTAPTYWTAVGTGDWSLVTGDNGDSESPVTGQPSPVLSDVVQGLGLGDLERPGMNIHTSYYFLFELVTETETEPGPEPEPGHVQQGQVIAPLGLNVRTGPGSTYEKLGTLAYGSTVLWDREEAGWCHVIEGWASGEYVGIIGTGDSRRVTGDQQPEPPATSQPSPVTRQDNWQRSLAFVLKWEGGWADDPNDIGGATMKGITLGTYTRWCEEHGKPQPSKEDLRNISDAEVHQIYYEWYWLPSHSNELAWPLCLANFNIAVNAGVGQSDEFLQQSGGDFLLYHAHAIAWYTTISGWPHYGKAWTRRNADLLREASA